jgi:ABC-type Fe3+-hydroxamate transport system substrate-binding protein
LKTKPLKFKDQLNREIVINNTPQRIISLVPSQTELLYDLGLKDKLVGQTIFCIHPKDEFSLATKIGGTKKLDIEKIKYLKPDLIIANKEENEKTQIEALAEHFPVWISDVNRFEDAVNMIHDLGEITQTQEKADLIAHQIRHKRRIFNEKGSSKPRVIYLIWKNPWIGVGKNTFIDAMLHEAGFENVLSKNRYPELSSEDIKKNNPDYIFLSTEPFPFKEEHKIEMNQLYQNNNSIIVDGEMFSWYGSRLVKAFQYFENLRKELNLSD